MIFLCNLFIFKEKQTQIQIQKTYDMHIKLYTDKRYLIYKTNILQQCTEILNTKDSFQWQPLFTYTCIFFLRRG